jgi:DNA polymerase-3 subunit gamma/tau
MSYQVIARKWRPQTFEEVTGQETVTKTLRNALEFDRLHHAYLFSGARGVGKTTTARLLAKALNCHKTDKPNLVPCRIDAPDACPSCIEISESRSIDVLEIDAASHTGIDAVRDTILEGININPARDRYKVFIIDEVHQLSKPAFNALLKTLEEPPPKVVFIMATTELHKVPDTILSRCQEFEFRTISVQKIFERLKAIAEAEGIAVSDDALREIARSGQGSMRDAQSNFDQVISFSGDKIAVDDVTGSLGIAGSGMLTRVIRAIDLRDPKEMLLVVDEIVSRGQDLRNFSRDLLSLFRDLLVFKIAGDSDKLYETAVLGTAELKDLADTFAEADLIRFFNSLSETESKLRDAVNSRYVLEVGLVKLIEMRKAASIEDLLERLARLEGSDAAGIAPPSQNAASASHGTAAVSEKKTLNNGPAVNIPVETAAAEPPGVPEHLPDLPRKQDNDLSYLVSMPVKLPPISAEELEHVDDNWLDSEYENRLMQSGDDLTPLPDAQMMVKILFPGEAAASANGRSAEGSNGAAAARALEISRMIPHLDDQPEDAGEIVPLPADATDEQLLAFAESHPAVRRVLQIFRGKIISVRRAGEDD